MLGRWRRGPIRPAGIANGVVSWHLDGFLRLLCPWRGRARCKEKAREGDLGTEAEEVQYCTAFEFQEED